MNVTGSPPANTDEVGLHAEFVDAARTGLSMDDADIVQASVAILKDFIKHTPDEQQHAALQALIDFAQDTDVPWNVRAVQVDAITSDWDSQSLYELARDKRWGATGRRARSILQTEQRRVDFQGVSFPADILLEMGEEQIEERCTTNEMLRNAAQGYQPWTRRPATTSAQMLETFTRDGKELPGTFRQYGGVILRTYKVGSRTYAGLYTISGENIGFGNSELSGRSPVTGGVRDLMRVAQAASSIDWQTIFDKSAQGFAYDTREVQSQMQAWIDSPPTDEELATLHTQEIGAVP